MAIEDRISPPGSSSSSIDDRRSPADQSMLIDRLMPRYDAVRTEHRIVPGDLATVYAATRRADFIRASCAPKTTLHGAVPADGRPRVSAARRLGNYGATQHRLARDARTRALDASEAPANRAPRGTSHRGDLARCGRGAAESRLSADGPRHARASARGRSDHAREVHARATRGHRACEGASVRVIWSDEGSNPSLSAELVVRR
jgi:hypothetical protein